MWVRILTSRDGHPCGAEVDVPEDLARNWIGAGDAEAIRAYAPLETAAFEVPETAMRESVKRGRK